MIKVKIEHVKVIMICLCSALFVLPVGFMDSAKYPVYSIYFFAMLFIVISIIVDKIYANKKQASHLCDYIWLALPMVQCELLAKFPDVMLLYTKIETTLFFYMYHKHSSVIWIVLATAILFVFIEGKINNYKLRLLFSLFIAFVAGLIYQIA